MELKDEIVEPGSPEHTAANDIAQAMQVVLQAEMRKHEKVDGIRFGIGATEAILLALITMYIRPEHRIDALNRIFEHMHGEIAAGIKAGEERSDG